MFYSFLVTLSLLAQQPNRNDFQLVGPQVQPLFIYSTPIYVEDSLVVGPRIKVQNLLPKERILKLPSLRKEAPRMKMEPLVVHTKQWHLAKVDGRLSYVWGWVNLDGTIGYDPEDKPETPAPNQFSKGQQILIVPMDYTLVPVYPL